MAYELVAMGGSWGGLAAFDRILPALPPDFPAAVAIVQHRGAHSHSGALTGYMRARSRMPLDEVDDKAPIEPGRVYLAPSDYHTIVEPGHFALSTEAAVHHSRPSIDVMFESAADSYGKRLIGVIVTGANDDGAMGIRAIKQGGGFTIVQDPAEAEKPAMPAAAVATGAVDKIVPLDEIAPLLLELCGVHTPDKRSAA